MTKPLSGMNRDALIRASTDVSGHSVAVFAEYYESDTPERVEIDTWEFEELLASERVSGFHVKGKGGLVIDDSAYVSGIGLVTDKDLLAKATSGKGLFHSIRDQVDCFFRVSPRRGK